MFFKPILQNPVLQQLPIWFSREFLLHLNRLFEIHTELIFTTGRDIQFLLRTVKKWMKIIMESGDYEYQVVLVEIIINTCEEHHLEEIFERSDDLTFLKRMFLKVHSRIDYVNDLEALLSTINNIFQRVRSIPCLYVTLEDRVIPPSKGGGENTWMHINYGVHTLSFNCDRNSLRSLPGSQSLSNFDEFVTVNFEDINKIGLLINNDCEGVNTVGGIFLMNISGQCSCRFDSSKEMVYSIKKILLKVSEGVHLNFFKTEFSKIFGNRFKQQKTISKKNRNRLEKKNSISSLLSHNLSFNTENRRGSYMKGNASIASNPENILTQDCKFDNSLTLENKENNLEDGSNSSLTFTGTRFSTPVGTKNKVTTNLQKCKSMSHNLRSMTPSSSNHLMPEKIKNKVLKVKDATSISPCTATKELISDSKTAQHSTNKVFTAKKERRCRNTKKSLVVLKNSEVDILTTSKNEEQILETFEIVPTSSLEIKQEDNKFDEECNYTILKGDQSSILDFINSKLDSIPELQSSVLKNESSKNKISKMNLDSSVSKTSSGTNNYELGLDVNLAASSTKITTLDNSNKPKGKNTTRMENRNTLRLLNSSEEAGAEDFKNSEIEVIDDNIPNVKNNGKEKQRRNLLSMKLNMPDSYTFQNKEEILTSSKKFHGIQDLLSRTINKKPINMDQRDTLENAEAINKKVIDNETEKEGESEYYSINEDVSLTNDNSATPDLYFENKSEKTKISQTHLLKELMKMNSEEIVNISVESKVNENDDLVTLQHQVFRDEESQYYSIIPDEAQIENNSETPNLDFHNAELQKLTKFDHNKNKPDTIEQNENNCFLLDEQASEYYSCDPAMIVSENNEVYDGIRNSETPDINLNKGVIQKNDNLIINDYKSDLVEAKSNSENVNKEASSIDIDLSAETVKIDKWYFPKNIPDDLISEIITSESNEKPERDFDNINIISISSTEESDSDVEFPDNPIEVKDTNDYLHMSDIEQNLFVNEIEIEMEEIPISEITESVRNDHCYSFNQGSQTKIDEDNLIECDANKINEFDDIDPLNCELIQSTQKSDQSLKNDAFDLNKTNSDVPLTCLVSENLEILDKGCKNIENLQNAITSTFTSMEHNSSQVACNEQHKSSNVAVAQNKVNILSNIRIAPPLCNKFNQSNNDFQLLNDKYVAAVNDLQNYKNELARAREHIQQLEAFERNNKEAAELTGNFETKKRLSDTPVTGNAEKKSKLTQEERKSKANDLEMMEVENGEVDHLREFVSIGKTSEKSVGKSKAEKNKLIDVQLTPRTYKSKEINENMNFNQQFDAFIKATLLDKVEPVKERKLIRKVQSISTKQKSKGNFEKLEVINEEDLGLATNKTIPRANEFNKKIDLDFDNFKMEKENDDLYNVIRKPQRSLKKSDKTGEANKTREIQRDEEYYQHVDSMYGFDAMLYALSSYLATWPEKKFKKPRKKNTGKIVLRLRKNARNKSKNKKYGKLF